MYFKLIISVLVVYLSIVESGDLRIGTASPQSKKIYGEIKEAGMALWRRTEDVVINAPKNDIIDAIYVTDLREHKDGVVSITSGGIGQNSVTITLSSPSILRGYKFVIEVFAYKPKESPLIKGTKYLDELVKKF
ncbi:hypothetical protein PYW07_010432 [Mythimna separata]|uniref:Uncharacterized protein n=1 Tax=Mythimna separata TaxID=271217 RepID=A0AAD7Y9U0_MYTSE|nr:hypothetical protein PYW07_010432 [Mythimna separata]